MIYTCTLSPSIDYLVELDELQLGALNRTKATSFYPGGKGINVSRVLKNLGQESTVLGYIGGFTGGYIRDFLQAEGIQEQFIATEQQTRVNIKLKTGVETEINGQGPSINEVQQDELLAKVNELMDGDIFVLAGSLPSSISIDFYLSLIKLCKDKNIPFIVDTSGQALEAVLPYRPFLIKPNQHELGDLFNAEISSVEEAIEYGERLLDMGPENIIVSLGGEGALLINKEITAFANVPKGELKNSVGAGDSMVAGFLASYIQENDFLAAFKYSIASGSGTAFSGDLAKVDIVEQLLPEIKVETIREGGR
ncbi:1-phosphofructokinase [Bacillus sp. FJAT-45350]|uniref:1-phosphofructokinase n=1 Tax=Bacillus sp. FJAT-45350 TaxID=2011014 RepID=UPI000BB69D79|nr:1-phosphofructokinase [Bacillus sp. FJAT-45350]